MDSPGVFECVCILHETTQLKRVITLTKEKLDNMSKNNSLEKDCLVNKAYMVDKLSYPSSSFGRFHSLHIHSQFREHFLNGSFQCLSLVVQLASAAYYNKGRDLLHSENSTSSTL